MGEGPAADGTEAIYGITDKGCGADATQPSERSESLVRLHSDGSSLALVDWFTPATWQQLDNADLPIGSGGVLLVPNSTLATPKDGLAVFGLLPRAP